MSLPRVVVASDHGGFALKEAIARHLREKGFDVLDVGTHSKEACDYPVFAAKAAEAVASGEALRGVIVDGAGIGSAMVANKVPGVRAGLAFDVSIVRNAREHNDANVLTLGAGYMNEDLAKQIVDVFLTTDCTVERHQRRVAMINALDAVRTEGTRSPGPMSSSPKEFDALVSRISELLAANPSLVSQAVPFSGGSCPTCTGCGHCASRRSEEVRSVIGGGKGARISAAIGVGAVPKDLASYIDHTLLRPDASYADIDRLCDEAAEYGFASVCVNPMHIRRCAARLSARGPAVCSVIGFPLGATPKEIKALEARRAVRDGAREIDMVIAIGALKSGDENYVLDDIRLVAEAAHEGGAILKVIIETALLTDEEKVTACRLAKRARADFVKTSTGFSTGGATAKDIALMARAVDFELGVKASGGIRSAEDAKAMVAAGATRIGASVGVKIAQESKGSAVARAGKSGGY
jgi:deoxyribose-phosphate aldolase